MMRRAIFLFVVFTTGACVLIVEIVATRILSPYFGSTIYTVSSVIGVILAALSAGYYAGGKIADRHPNERWFYAIIAIGGLSVFLLEMGSVLLLPKVAYYLSIQYGPLAFSLCLFFVPAFLLGMLSPFAVRLSAEIDKASSIGRIGSIAGTVFFWSTAGSIVGSLGAGFVLIPSFGIDAIVRGVAGVLALMGVAGLIASRAGALLILCVVFASGIAAFGAHAVSLADRHAEGVLYLRDGVYERIAVKQGMLDGKPMRYMTQDKTISGGVFLDTQEPAFPYERYFELYRLFAPEAKNILILGGGPYVMPRMFLDGIPDAQVDVAEIEPSLFALSKEYFFLKDSPRLANYIEDGRRFLHDTDRRYDVIFGDAFSSYYGIPMHLATREFFSLAESRLSDGGMFAANIIGAIPSKAPSLLFSVIRTFMGVFPNSYFFAVADPASSAMQNVVMVGIRGALRPDIARLPAHLADDAFFGALQDHLIPMDRFDLSDYTVLTDRYAPVEYLTAKAL